MKKALHGVKILDLSRVLAGPHGTMILGDLGADVVRVEHPERKDDMRHWLPFIEDESTYYLAANRNKQSITLNLKSEIGRQLFEQLVASTDVVVENFKAGSVDRLGIGYERLKEIKEDIILCSITGYGQTGPYREHPGYDPVIQAVGGLMSVTGHPDGEATRVGTPVVDIISSLYVAIGIMSAIRMRDLNGVGQHVDISLLDVQVASLANVASSYLNVGYISKRQGNAHANITPYETFECKDQPIMVAAGNDGIFCRLCQAIGHPKLSTDPRFETNVKRIEHRNELREVLETIFCNKPAAEWEQQLIKHKVPCGAVNEVDQVFDHPQVKHRRMVQECFHPTLGTIKTVRNPLQFSGFEFEIAKHPPLHGEHTEQILQERLQLNQDEIQRLRTEGVL